MEFVKGHGTENDFVVLPDPDGAMGKVLAAFGSYRGALSYVATRGRGHVWIITTLHPDGCDCDEAPPVDGQGRHRQRRGARN